MKNNIEKPIEWHESRQQFIGGSDVGAILGLNPYKSPLQVYEEKTAESPIITPLNAAMEFGLRLEDMIADKYSDVTGLKVLRKNKHAIHSKYPFMAAQVDRLIANPGRGTGVLEIKTANRFAVKAWGEDGLPLSYYAQLQHQFACTGHGWGEIALLIDGREFETFPFEKDGEFIEMMEHQLVDFWEKHVLAKNPPEPRTEEDFKKFFQESAPGKIIEAPDAAFQTYSELQSVKIQMENLKAEEERLKTQFKLLMGDAERLEYHGDVLATWKSHTRKSLDSKAIQKDLPEIYNQYARETVVRPFLVK